MVLVHVKGPRGLIKLISRSHGVKLDKNSPPIPVDSIIQQAKRRTGILTVRVQIPLESTFFSWLRQCQIIMKKFLFMYLWTCFENIDFLLSVENQLFEEQFFGSQCLEKLTLWLVYFWKILSVVTTNVSTTTAAVNLRSLEKSVCHIPQFMCLVCCTVGAWWLFASRVLFFFKHDLKRTT